MKDALFFLDGTQVEVPRECIALIKSKYRKEIAAEYGLSPAVFRRRLKKSGLDIGPRGYLDEIRVLRIYLALGWPCRIDDSSH
jgi:hypothetical protein